MNADNEGQNAASTPETNKARFLCYRSAPDFPIVDAKFASRLERERNEARAEVKTLRNVGVAATERAEKAESELAAVKEQLAAAKEQSATWKFKYQQLQLIYDESEKHVTELKKQLAAERKRAGEAENDAARYRWLRSFV